MKITPVIKGLITSALMIITFLLIYQLGDQANTRIQYLVYIIYALGITWTILAYRKSPGFHGRFGETFNQGFRCFIVVTLTIAVFYGIFNYLHPEFAEDSAKAYREHLEQQVKENKMLPTDIESEVATYKKQYTLKLVSGAIFGYLIIGAGVTAILSALTIRRK